MFRFAIDTFAQDMELLRGIPIGDALRECGAFLGGTVDVIKEHAVDLLENGKRGQEGTHADVLGKEMSFILPSNIPKPKREFMQRGVPNAFVVPVC